ncbi:type II secretion system GspH family protein [Candidatus Woesebacteria bacterium]|nr:type II secretion system GspH family protein [Candidatus Woesebacteria bacterium]MCD8507493.1 type II secretion system GspH family protein [Candidatus Woesebacteria bacterium]MCD8526948.1 type II secretion system GspH family protein [Candidatus Woesebacteria bacterium]MCD8545847.1 type II secretion system GspH family protein [Candidatus Woesebacteria bacterium]
MLRFKQQLHQMNRKGFTLIEVLVVIAIISILATVVFVALDPVTRFADARNARRWNDVNSILTAVHQHIVDNDGDLPVGLTTSMSTTEIGSCGSCVDLAATLSAFLASMPLDPSEGNGTNTGYEVAVDANNIVTVSAPNAENSETVQVSR